MIPFNISLSYVAVNQKYAIYSLENNQPTNQPGSDAFTLIKSFPMKWEILLYGIENSNLYLDGKKDSLKCDIYVEFMFIINCKLIFLKGWLNVIFNIIYFTIQK